MLVRIQSHDGIPISLAVTIVSTVDASEDIWIVGNERVWRDADEASAVALASLHVDSKGFAGEGNAEEPEEGERGEEGTAEGAEFCPDGEVCCEVAEDEEEGGDGSEHVGDWVDCCDTMGMRFGGQKLVRPRLSEKTVENGTEGESELGLPAVDRPRP